MRISLGQVFRFRLESATLNYHAWPSAHIAIAKSRTSPYPVRQVEKTDIQSLGIIAGSRELPLLIAREARRLGMPRIVAVAFHNETSPEIEEVTDEVEWLRVGQLSKLIKAFSRRDVAHCVMAGQIAPKNLFDFRPDLKTAAMLFRLKERNAHTIFGAIGDELAKGGVTLIDALPWLGRAMPGGDFHLGPKLSSSSRTTSRLVAVWPRKSRGSRSANRLW